MQQMQLPMGRTLKMPENVSQLQNPKMGHCIKNLNGKVFGRLTVIGLCGTLPYANGKLAMWLLRCTCGNFRVVSSRRLATTHSITSCGCDIEWNKSRRVRQANRANPVFVAFCQALRRCHNVKYRSYHNYGGRGIEFRFESFEEFYAELGDKPTPKHSLDRIDNDGHYEVGNVRWATQQEQCSNKQNTIYLTINNDTKTSVAWAKIANTSTKRIRNRLITGRWCHTCAVFNPTRVRCLHLSS